LDPNAKIVYSGPESGVGASFSWAGGNKIGEGSMTSTESRLNDLVRYQLDFRKPFAASNEVEFTLQTEGSQTSVTWSMSGRQNFVFKAVGLFVNCDKMCGDQFEEGFANLRKIVAAKP
jgi:hypothetical protein